MREETWHAVCHECGYEEIYEGEAVGSAAEAAAAEHERETGHRTSCEEIGVVGR